MPRCMCHKVRRQHLRLAIFQISNHQSICRRLWVTEIAVKVKSTYLLHIHNINIYIDITSSSFFIRLEHHHRPFDNFCFNFNSSARCYILSLWCCSLDVINTQLLNKVALLLPLLHLISCRSQNLLLFTF